MDKQRTKGNRYIGIDGFSLNRNDSGIEVYTRELINGLSNSGDRVEVYSYTDIALEGHDNLISKSSGLPKDLPVVRKLKWELFDIKALISEEIDLYHCPHFILPYNVVQPKVVTIHDLAFLRHPEFFDWKTRLYYNLFLRRSLKSANAIICISESCLQDLIFFFPLTRYKAFKVYHGFRNFGTIEADADIFKEMNIQSRFVLMIGTLNPRKNLANGIKAFEKIAREKDLELIVVGDLRSKDLPVQRTDSRVKFTGFITDEKLAALYRQATVLLFPSFYEGFGFPILEAASCGLPVVTSANSCLPEISGYPKEFLCEASDPDDIARKMLFALDEINRPALVSHGYENLKRFSWEKMVHETAQVYDEV